MTSSALLVKKLNPPGALGRLSSPLYNARNGALPPIGTLTALELESHPRYQVSPVYQPVRLQINWWISKLLNPITLLYF